MHVIFIRNYKGKAFIALIIALLWILTFMLSDLFMNTAMAMKVTINNHLTFSYPFNTQVVNIYYNENIDGNIIQTNSTFKKPVATKFSSYKSIQGKFSFQYPSAFILNEKDFMGSDILYHIDFLNKAQNAHGFVQVWNLPYDLKNFLESSKSNSLQTFKYFESKEITVNGLPGYYWDYVSVGSDGKSYKASEVFFKKDDKMYRISYFVPENLWSKAQSDIFWTMVNSLKAY